MTEEEFLNSIDCCFPYEQESEWRALIVQGKNISEPIIEAAKAIITNNLLSTNRVLEIMGQVQAYPDLYGALNIVYFACDDVEGTVDKKRDQIINFWNEKDS